MTETGNTTQGNPSVTIQNAIIVSEQPKQEAYPNLNKGNNGQHEQGRPTKYDIKYCEEIIAFFSIPKKVKYVKREKTVTKKNGDTSVYQEFAYMPNDLPTLDKFARIIGVDRGTLEDWAMKKYPDDYVEVEKRGKLKRPKFNRAYMRAKELQKEFLTDNGLAGLYNPMAFVFVANNFTDMRHTKPVDSTPSQPGEQIAEVASFNYVPPEKLPDPKIDEPNNTDNPANV